MNSSEQKYRCWFLVNQHAGQHREFAQVEQKAVELFEDFIKDKNYGEGIGLFRFDVYVEPTINYGHHKDSVYLSSAHLSAHLDCDKFRQASDDEKVKYLLNAALVLLDYLKKRVVTPKGFNTDQLVKDYEAYLDRSSLLLPVDQINAIVVKPFDTMKFSIAITSTAEVKDKDIHYDLIAIRDFINNRLLGQTFGSSVRKFCFGYEIYDFNGYLKPHEQTANLRRYGTKYKELLVVKQFDYRKLKDKTALEQFGILKIKILEAISDVQKLNRKPKDFHLDKFHETVAKILADYQDGFAGTAKPA